ncbi:hypothetical protein [Nocardia sp. R7R-8]|uniref:hypothetical protein n=1 Tax=Nocardia sp. R7R-8 TaxID=3459304 RepID=UPI00403D70DF
MSEDSKQLSVAELLARNGQQSGASSGGGRRRRGGRGISVAELTGDLPVIRDGGGHSAHAAPDSGGEEPASAPSSFDPPTPEPVSYAPEPQLDLPSYSPISGPISRYDPLAGYAQPDPPADPPAGRSSGVAPGGAMPSSQHGTSFDPLSPDTPVSDLFDVAPGSHAPGSAGVPAAPSRPGRRRRREEPEAEATEVRSWQEAPREPFGLEPLPGRGLGEPGRNGHGELDEPGFGRSSLPERNGARGGRAARRRAAEAAEAAEDLGPSTAAWSPATGGFAPESEPMPLPPPPDPRPKPSRPVPPEPRPEAHRRPARREGVGENGLPAWSARRHKPQDPAPEPDGIPTAAWSLARQDQQLLSGQTVAGDLLREGIDRAERGAERNGRGRRGGRAAVDAAELDGVTDVYEPIALDEDEDEDDIIDEPRARTRAASRWSRATTKTQDDENRRQWMILGGQSTGAAVAGMLLFKGFERMWEMLPWVALALAMIVILGLVALVRILRRTDDILSTVIAVVVGIFVTLGPLAFLLSTN